MGLGRDDRFSRCALPTTAFFEIPMRRPISAVESPSAQKARSRSIASCVQSMKEPPSISPTQDTVGKTRSTHNLYDAPRQRNLWKTSAQGLPGALGRAPMAYAAFD
jgi:hypothetical protein